MTRRKADALAEAAGDLVALARFSRDLPGFLRRPLGPSEAGARVQQGLARREERFLASADRSIFANAASPYLPLLRHAGCEPGDLRGLVLREGLDDALRTLAACGVYLAHDEAKGLRDTVRGSLRLRFSEAQFDAPGVGPHLTAETGGSSGTPTRVRRTLGVTDDLAGWVRLAQDAHGLRQPRHAFWMTGPVWWALIYGKLGQPVDGWFHPLPTLPWRVRLGTPYLRALGRLGGQAWPAPAPCDLNDPLPLARWLAERARPERPIVLTTTSSAAARVAGAARAAGLGLDGVTFVVKSEPLTETRRALVEGVGGRAIVLYGSMELPTVASGCASPTSADDMHLAADLVALITRRRAVDGSAPPAGTEPAEAGQPEVDALLLTTLSPNAAKICLNLELGDYADVETRDCGCLLGQLGLRTHLSGVRGFDKLTGEGVTFLRAHLETILERVLPERFGGSPLDYQLAEEEDAASGVARLRLRIAPAVGPIDEAAVRDALLAELARHGGYVQPHMAELWRRAATVDVVRAAPLATRAGKVLPFRPARVGQVAAHGRR